jgi:hypothetical protein
MKSTLLLLLSVIVFPALLQGETPTTRTERIPVVQIHVGGDDSKSDVFTYTAPNGWEITDVKLHETTKGGNARYSIASRTDKEVKVAWSVQSETVRGPFHMLLNTITAFLGLEMTVVLQKLPEPVSPPEKWPKIVAVASGIVFLVAILIIAIFIPYPSPFQIFVFRIIPSLAAGAFGAAIPGLFNLSITAIPHTAIEASGAIALFVLIYLVNPALLAARHPPAAT